MRLTTGSTGSFHLWLRSHPQIASTGKKVFIGLTTVFGGASKRLAAESARQRPAKGSAMHDWAVCTTAPPDLRRLPGPPCRTSVGLSIISNNYVGDTRLNTCATPLPPSPIGNLL